MKVFMWAYPSHILYGAKIAPRLGVLPPENDELELVAHTNVRSVVPGLVADWDPKLVPPKSGPFVRRRVRVWDTADKRWTYAYTYVRPDQRFRRTKSERAPKRKAKK